MRILAMKPQEVTDALKLGALKDKIWYVVPSCATTGEGLLEGLVSLLSFSSYSEEDRRHVQQYVSRAKMFMSNINQRRETMKKIAGALIQYQEEYLRQGVRHLRPLTRAQVASVTSLHESTVSRATAGKYVMLPNGQVVPFSDFFTASLSVKDVIKEIVEQEGRALTDREIVQRLYDQGIRVARRTVAKYRSQLRILPSKLRE